MNRLFINMVVVAALSVPSAAAIAQSTHYTAVGEGKYDSYMNFTGQVVENGVPVNGAEVAVFVGGECRQTQVSHNLSGSDLHGQPYSIDGLVTSQITFRGLQAGSTASVYAVNGTLIEQRKVVDDQPLTISLQNRPHGVYIVKAGTETIKVMKQ